jgi:hypothetical protein
MELLENLELVDVQREDKKAILIFLDSERGEIRQVNFNLQSYSQDSKKFVDDPEKEKKVAEWCDEYFKLPFDQLEKAIGERRDVFCYDNFNSLFEVAMVQKFSEDYVGQIISTTVKDIVDDGKKISIKFEFEGQLYESKMQYADYLESRNEWHVNPIKRRKQYAKFEEKFHIPVERMEEMIGKNILIEVKKAYGKFIYSEVKPFKKVTK